MKKAMPFAGSVYARDEEEEEKREKIGWEPAPRGEILDPLGAYAT